MMVTLVASASGLEEENGGCKADMRYRRQPEAQMSTFSVYGSLRTSSGLWGQGSIAWPPLTAHTLSPRADLT